MRHRKQHQRRPGRVDWSGEPVVELEDISEYPVGDFPVIEQTQSFAYSHNLLGRAKSIQVSFLQMRCCPAKAPRRPPISSAKCTVHTKMNNNIYQRIWRVSPSSNLL